MYEKSRRNAIEYMNNRLQSLISFQAQCRSMGLEETTAMKASQALSKELQCVIDILRDQETRKTNCARKYW